MTECDEIIILMDNDRQKRQLLYITTNVTSTDSINCYSKKRSGLLYFAYSFISDHIPIDKYYYLLLLWKTKRYNTNWKYWI